MHFSLRNELAGLPCDLSSWFLFQFIIFLFLSLTLNDFSSSPLLMALAQVHLSLSLSLFLSLVFRFIKMQPVCGGFSLFCLFRQFICLSRPRSLLKFAITVPVTLKCLRVSPCECRHADGLPFHLSLSLLLVPSSSPLTLPLCSTSRKVYFVNQMSPAFAYFSLFKYFSRSRVFHSCRFRL